MDEVKLAGPTEEVMKESIKIILIYLVMKMIKSTEQVHLYGQMVENILVNGKKENNMAKAYSSNLLERVVKVNG